MKRRQRLGSKTVKTIETATVQIIWTGRGQITTFTGVLFRDQIPFPARQPKIARSHGFLLTME